VLFDEIDRHENTLSRHRRDGGTHPCHRPKWFQIKNVIRAPTIRQSPIMHTFYSDIHSNILSEDFIKSWSRMKVIEPDTSIARSNTSRILEPICHRIIKNTIE
jgi:hypothetical protein